VAGNLDHQNRLDRLAEVAEGVDCTTHPGRSLERLPERLSEMLLELLSFVLGDES